VKIGDNLSLRKALFDSFWLLLSLCRITTYVRRFAKTYPATLILKEILMGLEGKLLLLAAMFLWPIFTLFSAWPK
jgi:hypothetical protein